MGKIIFYEGRNFQGRHWECVVDCADTFRHFSCCNSIRVTGGHCVAYEKANHGGYQYVLGPGDYPDFRSWMGFNDCIRSCQMFPPVFWSPSFGRRSFGRPDRNNGRPKDRRQNKYRGSFKMKLYNRPDMSGRAMELTDDCPDLYERFRTTDVYSCDIREGYWVFYEHPNYRGRQFFLHPGEYKACGDWGSQQPVVGSLRRLRTPQIKPNEQ